MADIATLSIKVDSSEIKTASSDVRDYVVAVGQAEKVSGVTGRALRAMGNEARGAAGSLARVGDTIGKLSGSDRSSPIKLSSTLIALNMKSSDSGGNLQPLNSKSQSAAVEEFPYRKSPEMKYYLDNRADEGKNASNLAGSIASQLLKSGSSLIPGISGFFADIFLLL